MHYYLRTLGWLLLTLVMAFNLGCAQTQNFIKADSARVSQEEKEDFSNGAGEESDWMMYQDMEGGGP